MRTSLSSSAFTVRQAAWVLGVEPSVISRAIRRGTLRIARRRGRLVVPASAVVRLLGESRSGGRP